MSDFHLQRRKYDTIKPMTETAEFWDFYWEVRLREMEDLGKREAILAASRLIRQLAEDPTRPVRMLELGCGAGQIIGSLADAHAQVRGIRTSCGVDYVRTAIEKCRQTYPGLKFIEGDFTDRRLLAELGQFEILLLVNALHEVFSAGYSAELGEVAVTEAKQQVRAALTAAVERLAPGGYLVLFDGLETSGDLHGELRIRFQSPHARRRFETFAREYHPFRISYRPTHDPAVIELSWRDFTRYITKSIFLDKQLWKTERFESYQYFCEEDFRTAFQENNLRLLELRKLTVNYEKWNNEVEIETPGADFPNEHILIVAQK